MFVVWMRTEVGRRPAIVFSECESCAAAFYTWMRAHNYAARFEKGTYKPEAFVHTDAAAAESADTYLTTYRTWRRTMEVEVCDHLQVLR